MRTKTLLLTAVLSAAGVATSMAQVFSVNAVGYVVKTIPKGKFALIANPLSSGDNKVNTILGVAPANTTIYVFDNAKATYVSANFDDLDNKFVGQAADLVIAPGNGFFVKAPAAADVTITFVGEVMQGTLSNPLPKGFSIKGSQVPQKGKLLEDLKLGGAVGDSLYKWDATAQNYVVLGWDDLDNNWAPAAQNTVDVAEAFFISKKADGKWDRTFSVN